MVNTIQMGEPALNEYMMRLHKELVDKRGLSEATAKLYVRTLFILNGRKVFKSLTFLKKVDDIKSKLADYAETSQNTMLNLIASVLSVEDTPAYKKLLTEYQRLAEESKKELEKKKTDLMNEKQKDNWLPESAILLKREELKAKVDGFPKSSLDEKQWETLLSYVVLSLYTETEPRRNLDYLRMKVVNKWTEEMPKDSNYLSLSDKKFVFNVYKTVKTYGTQTVPIPTRLLDIVKLYLSYYPKQSSEMPLLVKSDGSALVSANAITRILNKTFGKKIGSSALRHIILSEKYGGIVEEMKEVADKMAHSVSTQKEYIKLDAKSKRKPKESVATVVVPEYDLDAAYF